MHDNAGVSDGDVDKEHLAQRTRVTSGGGATSSFMWGGSKVFYLPYGSAPLGTVVLKSQDAMNAICRPDARISGRPADKSLKESDRDGIRRACVEIKKLIVECSADFTDQPLLTGNIPAVDTQKPVDPYDFGAVQGQRSQIDNSKDVLSSKQKFICQRETLELLSDYLFPWASGFYERADLLLEIWSQTLAADAEHQKGEHEEGSGASFLASEKTKKDKGGTKKTIARKKRPV